jgi:hypothetical protein
MILRRPEPTDQTINFSLRFIIISTIFVIRDHFRQKIFFEKFSRSWDIQSRPWPYQTIKKVSFYHFSRRFQSFSILFKKKFFFRKFQPSSPLNHPFYQAMSTLFALICIFLQSLTHIILLNNHSGRKTLIDHFNGFQKFKPFSEKKWHKQINKYKIFREFLTILKRPEPTEQTKKFFLRFIIITTIHSCHSRSFSTKNFFEKFPRSWDVQSRPNKRQSFCFGL